MDAQNLLAETPAGSLPRREPVRRDVDWAIVRLDFSAGYAEVWAQRRGLVARLKRLGFVVTDRQGRGVWLRGRVRQIRFAAMRRKACSDATRARLRALAKARWAQHHKKAAGARQPADPQATRA